MASHAPQVPSGGSSAAATTADPARIMLLAPYGGGMDQACNVTGDSETIAAGRTSWGHHISVSLLREPPPALSRVCVRFRHGATDKAAAYSTVVAAARGGSVLLRIISKYCYEKSPAATTAGDYFVYNPGAAAAAVDADDTAARPPSLYLLPPSPSAKRWWGECLDMSATGLVCGRGDAELVVAQLRMAWVTDPWWVADNAHKAAELLLSRDGEWRVVKKPRIVHGQGGARYLSLWEPQAVVALGGGGDDGDGDGGMLCWVDFSHGVVFSDVLGDLQSPTLRYVPFPVEAVRQHRRLVCTNARGVVKLVAVDEHAAAVVVVDAWTLKTVAMAWVLETDTTMVDSTELWALANTPGFARFHLVVDPAISMGGGGHVVSDERAAAQTEELDDHWAEATRGIISPKPKGRQVLRVIEHRSGMTQLMYV